VRVVQISGELRMPNEYSPYKAAHHVSKILDLREGRLIYPTQLQIDLTNLCNHHCIYCFSTFTISNGCGNQTIPKQTMFKLLDDAASLKVKAIHYTGGGEPFLHRDIYPILEKTIVNNLEFGMVTNGTLIDFTKSELLKKMAWIRISVDAVDAETYRKLRGVNEFDFIIKKIKEFKVQCPDTILGLSFVINPTNHFQIVEFAEMGKKLGVDNVRFSIAWYPHCETDYNMKEIAEFMERAEAIQSDSFRVFNLTKGRLGNLTLEGKDYHSCGYQHFTTVVGADSKMYPCCTMKYIKEACFGSLSEESFNEIWTGAKRRAWIYGDHMKNVCTKHICWMEEKNKFIGYLIEKEPKHVDFI